jgi:hypothetical protein
MDDDDEEEESEDDDTDEGEGKDMEYIVEKFVCTFHNGNYDAKFDDALGLYRSVPSHLLAWPTQASYIKPDNWQERNRIGLKKIKEQLQTCIESAHHSQRFNLCLTHNNGWGHLIDNKEPIVWHEPILDRYWDQLVAAMYVKLLGIVIVTKIDEIHVENVEIKTERLAALVAMLQNGRANISSRDVKLINTNLCGEGIVWLLKLVDVSFNLIWLSLHHNRIDDIDSARCLSRSLKSHACINTLSLKHCNLGSSPEILSVILQSDIKDI